MAAGASWKVAFAHRHQPSGAFRPKTLAAIVPASRSGARYSLRRRCSVNLRWSLPTTAAGVRPQPLQQISTEVYNGSRGPSVPRQFDVIIERDREGYYVASVPQIPGCHTQAQSLDDVTQRIREAIELCLEVEGAPEHDLEFVGIQRVTIAA